LSPNLPIFPLILLFFRFFSLFFHSCPKLADKNQEKSEKIPKSRKFCIDFWAAKFEKFKNPIIDFKTRPKLAVGGLDDKKYFNWRAICARFACKSGCVVHGGVTF
jgi:hypothetical protein